MTIVAIATGPAAGGIGILRFSGPLALQAARRLAPALPASPTPRHAYFTPLTDRQGRRLDEGLALYFAAPNSFTGEDVVELQAHGSPRLLQLLLAEAVQEDGVRLAQPGEFTRRAFVNGRMALSRAEAVADLIAAESEAQVRAAAAQLAGGLEERMEALHAPLLALQADLEGVLDFPDEAEGAEEDAARRLSELDANARSLFEDAKRGALLRRGARVVLFGPVNAGKSTLFNALVGAGRALVDEEPGTTRDVLEARLELDGLAVTLLDTAGLREGAGRVEAMGIERTRRALAEADVAVLLVPPGVEAEEWRREAGETELVVVRGKADLPLSPTLSPSGGEGASDLSFSLSVSGTTGAGLRELRQELFKRLGGAQADAVLGASERHLLTLERVALHVSQARTAASLATLEVVAGEVGLALAALAELRGADASTELLDAIFERFCIGK